MKKNPKRIMKRIAGRLFSLHADDFFASDLFLRFCREHDLDDAWKGLHDVSANRPELFGDDVMKNTVVAFLCHIFRSRPGEFPSLFSGILAGFMQDAGRPLPLDDLEGDLKDLGCPADDLEREFLSLRAREENFEKRGLLSARGPG